MKKNLMLALCFATMYASAQNVKLETGRKITITTTATNISAKPEQMGGGEMKTENVTTTVINITGGDEKKYLANGAITRITVKGDNMMGEVNFDSDKKDDRTSDMGQMLSVGLDKKVEMEIAKDDGKVTKTSVDKNSEEKEAGGGGLRSMSGDKRSAESTAASAFFNIPADKKVGDKWAVSSTDDGIKVEKNYELKEIKDGIATIISSNTKKGTTTQEARGMTMEMTIDVKGSGTILVDTKTGLVKKITSSSEMEGTMEVMGSSHPISSKSTSVTIIE